MPTTIHGLFNGARTGLQLTEPQFKRFEELISNTIIARQEWLRGFLPDKRRSLDDECGWPTDVVNPELYQNLYDRNPIAARVVEVWPRETWKDQPTIYEDEDSDVITPFEERWDNLSKSLRGGEQCWYQDEQGSPIWEYLKRADELSGIGHYGIILFGMDDGRPLSEPVEGIEELYSIPSPAKKDDGTYNPLVPSVNAKPYKLVVNAKRKQRELLYLRVFPESLVQITRYESNPTSRRYGKPTMYSVTLNDPRIQTTGANLPLGTANVHWTRVIHIADGLTSSELFGTPRMRPVLNEVLDIRKTCGSSGEGYYRGAFMGLSFETHPQLGGDVEINKEDLRSQLELYINGLQRYLALSGMSAKSIAPQVVDPTPHINIRIDIICIKLEIPKRIFMGSERGQLASGQDDSTWNDRVKGRRNNYANPRIIIPFVDRLILLGVLPEPKGFSVEWPDLSVQTAQEKTTVAVGKTQAITQYVSGGGENLIAPLDFLTRILDFTEDEAMSILEAAAKEQEEKMEEQQATADDMGYEPAPPPGFKTPEPEGIEAEKQDKEEVPVA